MDDLLQKMREACQTAREQQDNPNIKLQDVSINTKTGEFTFIWDEKK
ncbi:MAG: hypothetical protein SCK29_03765 [Bacillota bacterium]|nr:hypothetical protein [Bacillota bacterium]MDW7683223.1 hypothetical protein [Bacillota bacterium]